MTKPTIKSNGTVYLLEWKEEQITARVDRMREDSHFQVSAEVLFQSSIPGSPSHLHQARLNLTSTAARSALSRQLVTRINDLPWDDIIEQMSVAVLREYRKGDPVIEVSQIPKREGLVYRVKPFIVEGHPTLFYGLGGSAKSYLALYLATLLDQGFMAEEFEVEPGRVLYLDYEGDQTTFRERQEAIFRGLELGEVQSHILYRRSFRPLPQETEELQRIIIDNNIALVVVDSVGIACGGPVEESATTISYFAALRSLNVTSLNIGHQAKNTLHKVSSPFGSVYFTNLARNVYEIRAYLEAGERSMNITLTHTKSNTGMRQKPLGLHLAFSEDDTVAFSRIAISSIVGAGVELTLRERIIAYLVRVPGATTKALVEELGEGEASVRGTLNRYKDTFRRLGEGWVVLVEEKGS